MLPINSSQHITSACAGSAAKKGTRKKLKNKWSTLSDPLRPPPFGKVHNFLSRVVKTYIHCAQFQAQVHGGVLSLWTAPPDIAAMNLLMLKPASP
jgi:hypothetical protein